MASVAFSGLVSGLDTASLIDKLVAAETSSATTLQSQQSDLNTQKSIIGSLSSVLSSLGSLSRDLGSPSALSPRTATSSDSHVSVTASSAAAVTTHQVSVTQLARAQVVTSNAYGSSGAGAAGTGSVQITIGSTSKSVSWDATDSLASICSKINDTGIGASASVLYDGSQYRIVLAATATGTAAAPTFTETGSALGFGDAANLRVQAKDAKANIDGIDITRPTNTIDDAIAGVTFKLQSEQGTDPASVVSIELDQSALVTKLQSFVSAYNSVNSALHVQLDYTGTQKGTNTLFGDASLRELQTTLGSVMSSGYGASSATLGALGLTRDKTGAMTLDQTKLSAALAANPSAVQALFVTGGFATKVADLADGFTRTGDGVFAAKTDSLTSRYQLLQKQIDQINSRGDALRTQLQTQFDALEQAMSALQSQSSYISKIL